MPREIRAAGNHGGRRKKRITKKEWGSVDYMCMIHCTGEEIAGVLGIDYDTLNRNCKEQKGKSISEYIKERQKNGKMSLRRAQWKAAEKGNVTMLIWLGKQWLNQTEKKEVTTTIDAKDNFIEAISDSAKKDWEGYDPDI